MRIGILAHSFSSAFRIYQAIEDAPEQEVVILLCPSPRRGAWITLIANLVRLTFASVAGVNPTPIRLLLAGRVIFLLQGLELPQSAQRLTSFHLDVGLHKTGVIYRKDTIEAFRLGILNHHIGLLPEYRGRNVMEWSLLLGDPVGITVFFIDAGIDTGARIVLKEKVDITNHKSIFAAKQFLFDLDSVFFPKALALLKADETVFGVNDGSGKRYFVMSRLLEGVVQQLLQED
jgi:methionyl-tRNA formyltransferase